MRSTLLSALFGALFGGGASFLGTMYVARTQARRAERAKILTIYLQRVRQAVLADHVDPAPVSEACSDLYRHAAVAGHADLEHECDIDDLSDRLADRAREIALEQSTPASRAAWDTERHALRQEIYNAAQVYDDWLVAQLTDVHWVWVVLRRLGLPRL